MPDYNCYDQFGIETPCSAMEIGQQWYDLVSGWEAGGVGSGALTDWWETHVGPFGEEIGVMAEQFLYDYGQYMPNIYPDFAASDRYARTAGLQTEQLREQTLGDIQLMEQQVGQRGFTGSGHSDLQSETLLDQFQLDSARNALQAQQAQENLYTEWGQDFWSQLETLAAAYDIWSDDEGWTDPDDFEDWMGGTFEMCLNYCLMESQESHSYCLQQCTSGGNE